MSVRHGMGREEHDQEGRLITAEYPHLYVVNAYVPNSGDGLKRLDYRLQQWDIHFAEYLQQLAAKKPVVLTGDLNCCHQEIDIHAPKKNLKSAGFTQVGPPPLPPPPIPSLVSSLIFNNGQPCVDEAPVSAPARRVVLPSIKNPLISMDMNVCNLLLLPTWCWNADYLLALVHSKDWSVLPCLDLIVECSAADMLN